MTTQRMACQLANGWRSQYRSREHGETIEGRRNRLLHTFGNLTLLTQPLNSKVSNGPYTTKKPEITRQSTLLLNAYFQDHEVWDEEAILQRGRVLCDVALQAWPRPEEG